MYVPLQFICPTMEYANSRLFIMAGKSRAKEAALSAIQSPLLDVGIERATGIVWNITGGSDMTLFEVYSAWPNVYSILVFLVDMDSTEDLMTICWQVNAAAEVIYDLVDPNANLIFGAVVDEALHGSVSLKSAIKALEQ